MAPESFLTIGSRFQGEARGCKIKRLGVAPLTKGPSREILSVAPWCTESRGSGVASILEDPVRGHGKGPVQSCPRHKDKRA